MKDSPLINAIDAVDRLNQTNVKFVDVTWYMPNVPKCAFEDYKKEHIPGAVYFDIDKIAVVSSDLPHMYPSLEVFEICMNELGISTTDEVIVYDRSTFVASARAWWMLLSFGHPNVKVLDGGLQAWKSVGGSVESGLPESKNGSFVGKPAGDSVIEREEVQANLWNTEVAIVDARSEGRFAGTEPEPRPGLRGGHIPGSLHLYYGDVMDADGIMHSPERIPKMLDSLAIKPDQQVVTTCGSGVTAAILLLAFYQVRQDGLRMYDGSWTEWALHPSSPIESNRN